MDEDPEHPNDPTGAEKAELDLLLPKTRLAVLDGALVKLTHDDTPSARHGFEHISRVGYEKRFESVSLFFDAVGAGLLYFAWTQLGDGWLRWCLLVLGGLVLAFGLIGMFSYKVVVEHKGETLVYSVSDDDETALGFVATLRELLEQGPGRRSGL